MKPKHHQTAARLAALVYESECIIRSRLCDMGFAGSVAHIIDGAELGERVLVVPTSKLVFIIYRGTVIRKRWDFKQWIKNAQFRRRSFSFPRWPHLAFEIHRGFFAGWLDVAVELDELVGNLRLVHDRPIIIAGHSRGAAESICEMLNRVGNTMDSVHELHLFGCPRVLGPRSAASFNNFFQGHVWRWVANNDAVAHLPFRWMGFVHVGREMYFDSKDKLYQNPSFWRKAKGQARGRLKGGLFDGVTDHNAAEEYARLVGGLELD